MVRKAQKVKTNKLRGEQTEDGRNGQRALAQYIDLNCLPDVCSTV